MMLGLERMEALQLKAVQHGATVHRASDRVGPSSTVEWDVSGRCQRPATLELYARTSSAIKCLTGKFPRFAPSKTGFRRVILHTECRKCLVCRRKRQMKWFHRSRQEYELASRNWFGTLTLSPEQHFMCETRIRDALAKQGVDFEALSGPEKFSERAKEVGKLVTLWLKRVRKNSGSPLRYLLVCEAHKSGLPHVHVLMHEQDIAFPLRWKVLASAWQWGFCKFNLAKDTRSALYLTKYLTKALDVRVRASQNYGNGSNTSLDADPALQDQEKIHRLQRTQSSSFAAPKANESNVGFTQRGGQDGNHVSNEIGAAGLSSARAVETPSGSPRTGSCSASATSDKGASVAQSAREAFACEASVSFTAAGLQSPSERPREAGPPRKTVCSARTSTF